ncbi:MAG: type II toxin-antitoxin system RelE/ParE family toxin [Ruminococcus sp.]|jgi:mRNA interferase RelE/StbE|nr:type II toxin-antitoxin system RelE/ParE family toxin [Ruminococcus sp.]
MSWHISYLDEAERELAAFDKAGRTQIAKGILKALQNPLPKSEGGYGHPLGNKAGINLTGCLKLKFLKLGVRVVYKLIRSEYEMKVIIISVRADNEVYIEAKKRLDKDNL